MMTSRSSGPPAIVTGRVLTKILDLWLNYGMTPESIAAILQKEDGVTVAPGTVKTKIYENQGRIKGAAMKLVDANTALDDLEPDFKAMAKQLASQQLVIKRNITKAALAMSSIAARVGTAADESSRLIFNDDGTINAERGQETAALVKLAADAMRMVPQEMVSAEIRAPGSDKVPTLSQALAQVRALPSPENKG